ncbi:glycosyltransferase [Nocardioides guangzhouensis]|nr:glycosyltransferase [Nocardioides guangzhouensis]
MASDGAWPAISVVIATWREGEMLRAALESLTAQTLDHAKFEVVVAANGPSDRADLLVAGFADAHPHLHVRLVRRLAPGAAAARNWGVAAARGDFIAFLDDDDRLAPHYLESLLARVEEGVVPLGYVIDVAVGDGDPSPTDITDNYINRAMLPHEGQVVPAERLPEALSASHGKLVPRTLATTFPFRHDLRSSEDVVFWAGIFAATEFHVSVPAADEGCTYFRGLTADGLSRGGDPFQRDVRERLFAAKALSELRPAADVGRAFVRQKLRMQAHVVRKYIDERPSERPAVMREIRERDIPTFPYTILNHGHAQDLAVLYAFPPFQDTSAMVAARRIRERGEVVDVVSNNLDKIRPLDTRSLAVSAEFVDQHIQLNVGQAFSNWIIMERFASAAAQRVVALENRKAHGYRSVYSRAAWAPSHVAAALLKARRPELRWIAELSDPLLMNVHGQQRPDQCRPGKAWNELSAALRDAGYGEPASMNAWEWIEWLTYALADQVVFTNENQRTYMLDYCTSRDLARRARERSVVHHQPVPEAADYHRVRTAYELDVDVANIGYFGVFYANRGAEELLGALEAIGPDLRTRIRIHIFTDRPRELWQQVAGRAVADTLVVNPMIPYFEFLNLTTRLDVLFVQDAQTASTHPLNPYLPSKISDYLGSGTPIWAVVEPGSVLSSIATRYQSELGNREEAKRVLRSIVKDLSR